MHILSIFVLLALAIVLISYISYPFRSTSNDLDHLIELEVEKNKKSILQDEEKYCPRCGNRLSLTDRFCSQCGSPVEEK
jgi:hypothetical protein